MDRGFVIEDSRRQLFEGIRSVEDLNDDGGREAVVRAWFWSHDLEQAIAQTGTKRLFIWSEWPITDSLAFLTKFKDQLVHLAVLPHEVTGLPAISELGNLTDLRLRCSVEGIDFTRLRALATCGIEWEQVDKTRRRKWTNGIAAVVHSPALRVLGLSSVPLEDLRLVAQQQSLRECHIADAPLRTLNGVDRLRNLRKLTINAALLESLDGIEGLNLETLLLAYLPRLHSVRSASGLKTLKSLCFLCCKKISDFDRLEIPSLEVFEMEACGQVPSLAFMRHFPNLQKLRLWHTSVADGDLKVVDELLTLRLVEIVPYKKHYRPAQHQVERGVPRGLMNIRLPA